MTKVLPFKTVYNSIQQEIQKYKKLRDSLTFTAIDFETANEMYSSACCVGYVRVEHGKIVDMGCSLIYPRFHPVSSRNYLIHGISNEQLQKAPTFDEIWVKLQPLIEGQIVVSHNSSFDINVLEETAEYNYISLADYRYMCSHRLVQEAFPSLENYRLNDCAKFFGLNLDHHNALSDALVCAEITLKALKSGHDTGFNYLNQDLTGHIIKKKSADKLDRSFDSLVGHKKVDSNLLKPNLEAADKEHVFYNKKIVFTGDLKTITRHEAAAKVQALGGDINTAISKKTNIVIMGEKAGPSKLEKIFTYNSEGCNIQIIEEEEFLTYLN
ncbi:hypothetical protein AHMF7605_22525 [Adhaeribacter arboris]|uniref:BRCT domain-containing protein n=1 Tax=Adhaeribacter arboris TaxID=2072846 RepID=A0A2T2YKP0_9BACT|nr:exonuclease domain-containing protein [Adhaeribacter arboris]PSR56077.1 hypothetical protein AHMF7605_22525 [Adhaeribacter arboris]